MPSQQATFQQRIQIAIDNFQEEFQIAPIETLGTLFRVPISILIETSATENFIAPRVLSKFPRRDGYMENPWTIKYENQSKDMVEQCLFEAKDLSFSTKVNI